MSELGDFGPILSGYRSWMDDALCAEVGGDLFFPTYGESTKPAKSVCAACSVVEQCAQYALDEHIYEGVWGGMTREDRKQIWRERGVSLTDELGESA